MTEYSATTERIQVNVKSVYLDGQSSVYEKKFVFAYFIHIHNQGDEQVQLMRRHWLIRDSRGNLEELEGEGVVGKQPILRPDEVFEYNSICVLKDFLGWMEGSYLMKKSSGEIIRIYIPRFTLRALAN
jgi:ApaG protein